MTRFCKNDNEWKKGNGEYVIIIITLFLSILVIATLSIGYFSGKPLGGSYVEISDKIKTGYEAFYILEDNITKEKSEYRMTYEEYLKLGLPYATNPSTTGKIFVSAYARPTYASTTLNDLKDNEYFRAGVDSASSTIIKIKPVGENATITKASKYGL